MKKYTCPKCGSTRTVSEQVVACDIGCGCRVGGYTVEYTADSHVTKYPGQVLAPTKTDKQTEV